MQQKKLVHFLQPLLFFPLALNAQTNGIDTTKLNTPGPANLDTSKFSTFYIIRPDGETGKSYYIQLTLTPAEKKFYPKLEQLNETDGTALFDKISYPALYVYDPDPFTNGYYVWPNAGRQGYTHMNFALPLSTRHYFASSLEGFMFSYYNKTISPTYSEVVGVYGDKKKLSTKEDFLKFADKQVDHLKNTSSKTATIKSITPDYQDPTTPQLL